MADGDAILHYGDGKELKLPVLNGSEGEVAIDVARLRTETGMITLDNGFGNTGACRSAVTFVDGERGILRYRGYPIEQLAESCSFLEVTYLLTNGELPTKEQLGEYLANRVNAGHARHT